MANDNDAVAMTAVMIRGYVPELNTPVLNRAFKQESLAQKVAENAVLENLDRVEYELIEKPLPSNRITDPPVLSELRGAKPDTTPLSYKHELV